MNNESPIGRRSKYIYQTPIGVFDTRGLLIDTYQGVKTWSELQTLLYSRSNNGFNLIQRTPKTQEMTMTNQTTNPNTTAATLLGQLHIDMAETKQALAAMTAERDALQAKLNKPQASITPMKKLHHRQTLGGFNTTKGKFNTWDEVFDAYATEINNKTLSVNTIKYYFKHGLKNFTRDVVKK